MDIDKLLLKPNIDALDINTQRIRRNLIVTSIISIFLVTGAVNFDNNSNRFAGFKFQNIEIDQIYIFFLLALIYFFVHFVWAVVDEWKENRLRLTGIKIPKATIGSYSASITFEPNTDEVRQSTMFSWWKGHRKQYIHIERIINSIDGYVQDEKYELAINTIKSRIEDLHDKSLYIKKALLKFEKSFWSHQRSQVYRWFILDLGIPCLLACASLILILAKLAGYIAP